MSSASYWMFCDQMTCVARAISRAASKDRTLACCCMPHVVKASSTNKYSIWFGMVFETWPHQNKQHVIRIFQCQATRTPKDYEQKCPAWVAHHRSLWHQNPPNHFACLKHASHFCCAPWVLEQFSCHVTSSLRFSYPRCAKGGSLWPWKLQLRKVQPLMYRSWRINAAKRYADVFNEPTTNNNNNNNNNSSVTRLKLHDPLKSPSIVINGTHILIKVTCASKCYLHSRRQVYPTSAHMSE